MRKFFRFASRAYALAALSLPHGLGTSCSSAPACTELRENRVIFVGHVIESGLGDDNIGDIQRPARLKVREALIGLREDASEVELQAVWPQPGELLLVYASRGVDGKLYLGTCNGTRPVNEVPNDLKFLRRVRDGREKASFSGYIDSGYESTPIAGVTVTITSENGASYATLSDDGGEFAFHGLSPGAYEVRMEKEGYVPSSSHTFRARLDLAAGECGWERAQFHRDGEVSGVVRNSDGTAAPGVTVELLSIKADGSPLYSVREAVTGPDGRFSLTGVEPGSYFLGINVSQFRKDSPYLPTLFPGVGDHRSAAVLTVGDRQKFEAGEFRLPEKLQSRQIAFRVTWPDGTPATSALVRLRGANAEGNQSFSLDSPATGKDGIVEVTVFPEVQMTATARVVMGEYQGRKYLIWQSDQVHVARDATEMHLVVAGPPPPATRPRTRLRDYLNESVSGSK